MGCKFNEQEKLELIDAIMEGRIDFEDMAQMFILMDY